MFLSQECIVLLQTMVPTIQTFPCHRPPPLSDPLPFGLMEQCIIQREHASLRLAVATLFLRKIQKVHIVLGDLDVDSVWSILL